jgi:hypothetical protein
MTLVLVNDIQNRPLHEPVRLDRRRRRLSAVVKRHAPKNRAYLVSVHRHGDLLQPEDHTVKLRKTWAKTLVGPNDIVVIKRLPLRPIEGGGGGGDAKQIGGLVAMIAVALAAPWLVGGLASAGIPGLIGAGGQLTFAGQVLSAGLVIGNSHGT